MVSLSTFLHGLINHLQFIISMPLIFLNLFSYQEYKKALRYINRLLQIEPTNRQAIELQEKINDQMKKGQRLCGLIVIVMVLCVVLCLVFLKLIPPYCLWGSP